jgi:hypothetical protein
MAALEGLVAAVEVGVVDICILRHDIITIRSCSTHWGLVHYRTPSYRQTNQC